MIKEERSRSVRAAHTTETQSTQRNEIRRLEVTAGYTGETHLRGLKTLVFPLVRVGGLCLYSRDF